MSVDLGCLVLILLFGLLGWASGILWQVLQVACLVAAYFLSVPVVGYIEPVLSRWEVDPSAARPLARLASWFVIYLILRVAAFWINRAVGYEAGGKPKKWNRKAGTLVGLLQGVAVAVIAVSLLDVFIKERPAFLMKGIPAKIVKEYNKSYSREIMNRYNPLEEWGLIEKVDTLLKDASQSGALEGLQKK